ncbi:maltase A3-like [Lutzomyia longipalpis]|uniref:maltase A3-like n=1 Tax=Lutzomyia longipalpis TaxID=7200 RepID=UPI00248366E7|nr:maltase A3-like [Lutzomyia longipalpis]XP_055694570.1 maltase A3-like [Lutzomyia longipalpis]
MNNVRFVLLCLLVRVIGCDFNWWRTANFYQIYPRSFKDSNGDGVGDLNGITEGLPYLKYLGINAIWISPIFASPMMDMGYDISDFYNIHFEYGTMQDFERLLTTAHDLKLKILLDFVPNHSSHENEWFKRSAAGNEAYKDFYIWYPGKEDPSNPLRKVPPSNWRSVFRGSAWTFHEGRGEYYLHQFGYHQPDLNYRNPQVVETMKEVLRFWLDKGVDGFRVDALQNLFEIQLQSNGQYPDEPLSNLTTDEDSFNYVDHIYTMDQPETIEMIYQWREVLDKYTKEDGNMRTMMAEADPEIDILMKYYGDGIRNGSHIPFNFKMLLYLKNDSNAIDFKERINLWLDNLPEDCVANWVMGNHDRGRIGTRFGINRIDLINMIINTLPGISITYYGEEIGMTDVFVTWEQTVDPSACSSDRDSYEEFSRDPCRTPFQWDSSTSAGFSTSPNTWLPVSSLYQQVNVKVQKSAPRSHLKVYRQLLRLRHTETLQKGSVEIRTHGQNVLSITRRLSGRDTYITIANIGGKRESIDIREIFSGRLIFHIIAVNSRRREGDSVRGPNIGLEPHEAFILRGVA